MENEELTQKKSLGQKIKEKSEQAKRRRENFQLLLAFVGAIYFVVNIILTVIKNYNDSPLFPFLIGCSAVYIIVFIVFIILHRKDRKQIKKDTSNFKTNLQIVKLIMNLLFIASSLLIFIESVSMLSSDSNVFVIVQTAISGFLITIKLLSTLIKLIKTTKKQVKGYKKDREERNALKEQQK